jgi:hypothetical protein
MPVTANYKVSPLPQGFLLLPLTACFYLLPQRQALQDRLLLEDDAKLFASTVNQ